MKYRLVELLQDPTDGTALRVRNATTAAAQFHRVLPTVPCKVYCALKDRAVTSTSVSVDDCVACYSREVVDGELVSGTGNRYPIVKGIPRLLSRDTARWLRKNQDTFSLEWEMFRFGERNWGQDIRHRKALFLRGLALQPSELHGSLMLDAGCGSGLLSMELAESYGMEVVAMDLAFGIDKAYAHNNNPFVYFVQGSVLEPPLRSRRVDLVYCAGVLVALPDPQRGFEALRRTLKPGGRYLIWMYHPIDDEHHPNDKHKLLLYNWLRTRIVSRLPIRLQYLLFLAAIPLYLAKRELGPILGSQNVRLTWREKMQSLTDMFSPVYQHRYPEEAIVDWYENLGFVNVRVAYQERYGFAVRGDMPSPHDADSPSAEVASAGGQSASGMLAPGR